MREVRRLDQVPERRFGGWFSLRWAAGLGAAAALVLAGVVVLHQPAVDPPGGGPVEVVEAPVSYEQEITIEEFAEELEELAYLSDLMAVPDTSLLADEDLAALLF